MSDEEVVGLQKFLSTYPDRLSAHCRRVPVDPEPLSDEAIRKIREAEEWLEKTIGRAYRTRRSSGWTSMSRLPSPGPR